MVGMISVSNYNDDSKSLVFIEPLDKVLKECKEVLNDIVLRLNIPVSIPEFSNDIIDELEKLFPVLVVDNGEIYYTNPLVIDFLMNKGLDKEHITKDKKLIISILKVLEAYDKESNPIRVRLTAAKEIDYLDTFHILSGPIQSELQNLYDAIKTSKCMANIFDNQYKG
jgi:ABC-type Na+ transport system ATPase subunit NatA